MINSVGIIGAGPAGCALACFLVKRGVICYVFDDNKKPELLVGESLIPAAIPILQKLGIEEEVARISTRKEGAALRHYSAQPRVDFEFKKLGNSVPNYAYNVPRPQFDALIRARAESLGVQFIDHQATVLATPNSKREISLSHESLAAAGLDSDQHRSY
jgi:2-polyprenyl-6-methoxyphenol hydroxylase-like FAD-dependent oxidoreductase